MNKYLYCLSIILPVLIPGLVFSQEETEFSLNTWMSQGQTKWRHDSQSSLYGVPTSELDYQGVNSQIIEISVLNHLLSGHSLKLTLGTGVIDEGTLVDDDYLSASGAVAFDATQSGAHRFSRTHSDIDGGGLFYFKGEFSPQDFHVSTSLADLRFSLGFHRWKEEYIATGIRSLECTVANCWPVGSSVYQGVTVISNKVEWTGIGIAMDGLVNFTETFSLKVDVTYYPIMSLVNEDIHHLRTTGPNALAQDPSIRMTGNGSGYDLATSLQYRFAKDFSVHLGYRLWDRWVKNQTITFYGASGGASSVVLMDFRTRRDGFVAGVTFEFN